MMIIETSSRFMHATSINEISTQLTHLNTSIIYQFDTLKPELPHHSTNDIVYLKTPKFTRQPSSNIQTPKFHFVSSPFKLSNRPLANQLFSIHPNSNLTIKLGFMHNSKSNL